MRHTTKNQTGSALILVVALTTLLAAMGVMFVMTMRIDQAASTGISESKQLDAALESAAQTIANQLYLDVPGVTPGNPAFDYPGEHDPWLASIQPTADGQWPQISDVTGYLRRMYGIDAQRDMDIDVLPGYPSTARYIPEYPRLRLNADGEFLDHNGDYAPQGVAADASGDGIADSKWIVLDEVSADGQPILAAIRVIDNAGMLNLNTGYSFDPQESQRSRIDGRCPTQINIAALSRRGDPDIEQQGQYLPELDALKSIDGGFDIESFRPRMWRFGEVQDDYTLFDISDELELRYRYLLRSPARTRITNLWDFNQGWQMPMDGRGNQPYQRTSGNWIDRVTDPNDSYSSLRHLATTYSIDRSLDPTGRKQININRLREDDYWEDIVLERFVGDPNFLRYDINRDSEGIVSSFQLAQDEFDQILLNMRDFDHTTPGNGNGDLEGNYPTVLGNQFGFRRPLIFISEIARFARTLDNEEEDTPRASFAIELYKMPGNETWEPGEFVLTIDGAEELEIMPEHFAQRGGRFYVQLWEDPEAPFRQRPRYSDSPWDGATGVDPNVTLSWAPSRPDINQYDLYLGTEDQLQGQDPNLTPRQMLHEADRDSPFFVETLPASSYSPELEMDTTYYWRIDDVGDDDEVLFNGGVWQFTTWAQEPNDVRSRVTGIDELPISEDTQEIAIERRMQDGTFEVVDRLDFLDPPHYVDTEIVTEFFDYRSRTRTHTRSWRRDTSSGQVIKRIWDEELRTSHSLGHHSNWVDSTREPGQWEPIQLHVHHNRNFRTLGEVGLLFKVNPLTYPWDQDTTEQDVRVDLREQPIQRLLQYLTRIDAYPSYSNNPNEARVPGRININTAPEYVIAQLPWVAHRNPPLAPNEKYSLANAITTYRDYVDSRTGAASGPVNYEEWDRQGSEGFRTIGQLNHVFNQTDPNEARIDYYAVEPDLPHRFPDLTFGRGGSDGYRSDFEKRDLIFHRISDLVTVRSDVFTAYILVRLGTDGPQKRAIAIFDRSGVRVVYDDVADEDPSHVTGSVRIRALQKVPDPR